MNLKTNILHNFMTYSEHCTTKDIGIGSVLCVGCERLEIKPCEFFGGVTETKPVYFDKIKEWIDVKIEIECNAKVNKQLNLFDNE